MKKLLFVLYPILLLCLLAWVWSSETALEAQAKSEETQVRLAPTVNLELLGSGFNQPLGLAASGMPGDERLFVLEKGGRIKILRPDGTVAAQHFLNISNLVATESERGLLGMAFDPNYAENGYFYVNYSRYDDNNEKKGDTVIARYQVQEGNPDVMEPHSGEILLIIDQDFANHNGGDMHFGPDGYLYISLGDGGSAGDPKNRGQTPDNLLGTILRIDVHSTGGAGACGPAEKYGIPADNPFVDEPDACSEIWAYGLRNPWRISFDRLTHDLYIADVGQNAWEEVNFQPHDSAGGENYGWRCYEGTHAYNTAGCGDAESYEMPFFEYDHTQGASITGGYVYRGQKYDNLYGTYFFGDFVTGAMWTARPGNEGWMVSRVENIPALSISAFGEDNEGELYVVNYGGEVYRLQGEEEVAVRFEKFGPASVTAGEPFTYRLEVENTGNTAVSNLVITDRVPLSATFISSPGGQLQNGVVRWEAAELLPNNVLTVQMTVSSTEKMVVNNDYMLTADLVGSVPGTKPVTTIIDARQYFLPLLLRSPAE